MGLFSKKSFVGLDLGHHTIKAIQLDRSSGGWKVTKVASTLTPPESVKDGVVIDTAAVAASIKGMLKEAHINATSAHIAVAGGSVFVRSVRMPRMTEATLRKSIRFEAGRYVPGSADDCYIEFEILGPVEENQMDVLVVAAPKDIVNSRVEACGQAGLDVESVEVEAFSLFRSLVEADPSREWAEKTIAILDIGALTTSLSIVHDGHFAMIRSLPHGGGLLTEALRSYFKLEVEDAEAGKAQLDVRDLIDEKGPKENPPLRVLQPHIDELVREIRRSLNYYQSQKTEGEQTHSVDLVLVTGGGSKLPGLPEYVAHRLNIAVEAIGPLQNPRFTSLLGSDDGGLDLSVATGLAMRAQAKVA